MAFSFDATVGGAGANSYVAVAKADDYFAGRLNASAWPATSAGSDLVTKQKALAMATARIDQEQFDGTKTDVAQRLKFPRYGASDESGVVFDSTIIPLIVEQATYEEALFLLQAGTSDATGGSGLELFKRIEAGSVKLEMFDRPTDPVTGMPSPANSGLPPQVMRLLAPVMITYRPAVAQFEGIKLLRT